MCSLCTTYNIHRTTQRNAGQGKLETRLGACCFDSDRVHRLFILVIKLAVVSDNIDNRYHTEYDSDDTLYETKDGIFRRSSSMFLLGIVEQPSSI